MSGIGVHEGEKTNGNPADPNDPEYDAEYEEDLEYELSGEMSELLFHKLNYYDVQVQRTVVNLRKKGT